MEIDLQETIQENRLVEKIRGREKTAAAITAAVLLMVSPVIADQALTGNKRLEFKATANISEAHNASTDVGLAPGGGDLSYGKINAQSNSTRFINISSEEKTWFNLEASGNISEYLYYTEEMTFKGMKNIPVELSPEKSGYYTGKLVVKAEYGKGGLGRKWMDIKH
ncbi:MAG: hypothetical protein ABEJ93_01950 [Candidatus Nanohalobium sp.]